jgi:NAD(P)H-dependent flavin oxidoreductase YrpB (nitropropane dioxygenase family)
MGTRFVAATESGAHPAYVKALLASTAADTCLTEAFSGLWPNAPHRVLRSAIAAAEALTEDIIGEAHYAEQVFPVRRFSVIAPTITTTGHIDAMALYAGESVTNVTSVQPAAVIVSELVAGAERLLGEVSYREDRD